MEKVNLMGAREGDSPEAKQGNTEYRILSSVRYDLINGTVGDFDSSSGECHVWVRFYKNARAHETRSYRVADSSVMARLVSNELILRDLVQVRFSKGGKDGKEVVEMVKLGHLYLEGEEET